MKRNKTKLTVTLLGILIPLAGQAENIGIDFSATVVGSTCTIKLQALNGSQVADNGSDKYTLTIPDVKLSEISNKETAAQADFKFVASGCTGGVGNIGIKIAGTAVSGDYIKTTLSGTDDAKNIGMGFKERSVSGEDYIAPNSAESITWSTPAATPDKEMTVALRETSAGQGTSGAFESTATFSFTYQ